MTPELAAFLDRIGLSKYARTFEENEIDFDSLPHLTESMLTELGMPIGPRAKVLAAIAELRSEMSSRSLGGQWPQTAFDPRRPRPRPAERRQITVLFCDLVGSTEFATRLDPEDFRALIHAYQSACRSVIARYGGHISQYLGDGIEVYFGWPTASEDSAERAVRAGLDAIEAVKAITQPAQLAARVGISTGIVVISDTAHGDASVPTGAIGDATYVAARLQAFATTNSVIVSESTDRLISARFEREDLGLLRLKGIAEPVRAFRVRHARDASARFDVARAVALTPLVGRRAELALLRQRWRDASEGEGRIVYLSGVPGIGKSRIVHELELRLERGSHFSLKFQCLPFHRESAFFPVIQQVARLAGLRSDESDRSKLWKLERLLAQVVGDSRSYRPLIANMLSIPFEGRYPPLDLSAAQVKGQTLSALVDLLVALSQLRPVLCLVEDAQWIDPSTQELLDEVVAHIARRRILLVATHRPEYRPNLEARSHVSALTISRLSRSDVAEMAQFALRDQPVPASVMDGIVNESDCVPLFVEELARGIVESPGAGQRDGHEVGLDPTARWSVPVSLRDSLVARLDQAPQGRAVAQIAAVVGREFDYGTLSRVSMLSQAELDSTLSHLQRVDIVQKIDGASARYVFKHALLRDAAYESLLNASRREIHAKVGAAIETASPEIVEDQPELLAYHYSMAGVAELAARYWMLGGQRARSRSANAEATVQYQNALEALRQLPATPERASAELDIQLSLGLCVIAVRGYSSDGARDAFERACGLSVEAGDPNKEAQAIFGLWGHHWMAGRHDRAIELSETLLARAELLSDPIALTFAHRSLGSTLFTFGDFVRARRELERAVALGRERKADLRSLSLSYAVDPRIASELILSWVLWNLGFPDQAHGLVSEALADAAEQSNPYSIAFAHYVTCAIHLLRGDSRAALEHANLGLEAAREHRINLYVVYSQFARGCALLMLGRRREAMRDIREGIEQAHRINLAHMRGFMLGWLAAAQNETGDPEAALATLDDALRLTNDVSGRAWEGELRRLRGDVLLALRPHAFEEAEQAYEAAIAIARGQHARSFELRATVSLARLLLSQGRGDEGAPRLDALLAAFTEGFDTADLRGARAMLGR